MTDTTHDEVLHEVRAIRDQVQGVSERLFGVETRVNHELASRIWVNDALAPVKESSLRTEHALQTLTKSVMELTQDTKGLYASHDQLLKERSEREKEEHALKLKQAQENTWSNIIKDKWAPILGFVVVVSAVLALGGQLLHAILQSMGFVIGK